MIAPAGIAEEASIFPLSPNAFNATASIDISGQAPASAIVDNTISASAINAMLNDASKRTAKGKTKISRKSKTSGKPTGNPLTGSRGGGRKPSAAGILHPSLPREVWD